MIFHLEWNLKELTILVWTCIKEYRAQDTIKVVCISSILFHSQLLASLILRYTRCVIIVKNVFQVNDVCFGNNTRWSCLFYMSFIGKAQLHMLRATNYVCEWIYKRSVLLCRTYHLNMPDSLYVYVDPKRLILIIINNINNNNK